jgi:hypothetical protein
MNYKFLKTGQADKILYTEVKYTLGKNNIMVEIERFNSQLTEEVRANFLNKADSESKRIQIRQHIKQLLSNIELNQHKNINI